MNKNIKIKKINKKTNIERYPNLVTVLMVEKFLQENCDIPLKISQIRQNLPKQVMHQTLKLILEYLWASGKIIYGPKGMQWIYTNSTELDKLIRKSVQL